MREGFLGAKEIQISSITVSILKTVEDTFANLLKMWKKSAYWGLSFDENLRWSKLHQSAYGFF